MKKNKNTKEDKNIKTEVIDLSDNIDKLDLSETNFEIQKKIIQKIIDKIQTKGKEF